MSQLKKGATLSYLLLFLNNIIRLAYTPFLIRSLGQSEYGLYSLAAATVGYLSIMDLGFGNAIIRFTSKYKALGDKETENKLHGMFIVIYTMIGFVVAIAGVVLYFQTESIFGSTMSVNEIGKVKLLILLLTFNLAITFPFSIFGSIITANEKFVFLKMVNIVSVILNPLIMIPLLIYGYKSIALVLVMTSLNIFTLLMNFYYCKYKIKINPVFGFFDKTLLKEILGYSFFVFLSAIVDQVYWNSGQFILGSVSGSVTVAVYSVAITLKNLYFSFSSSIVGVLLPKVTKMVTEKVSNLELTNLFIKVGRLQFIILSFVLVCLILFGERFVVVWAGENYRQSYLMGLCIIIPVTIPLIQNLGVTILQAKNKQKFRSVLYVIIAVFNIAFSIPLAKEIGGMGCAIVTGFSLFIGNGIIMNVYYHREIKLDIIKFWKEIFKLSIPAVITGGGYVLIKSILNIEFSYLEYGIEILLFSLVFAFLMWFMGVNSYEKLLITKSFYKVLKVVNRK